jgi:hypothetical protein
MSRDFDGASSGLARTSNVITAFPFSISIWVNPDTLSGSDKILFSAHDNPSVALVVACALKSLDSWKPTLYLFDGDYKQAVATTGATTGAWQHAGFVAASSTSYSAYYNGGSKGTTTTAVSMTLSNMNRTALGKQSFDAAGYFDGRLAHCAVWNVALADAEMEVLAAGLLPTRVRPASLVAYWSLSGKDDPEIDIVGRNDLTITSTAASNEEPRVFRNYA